MSNNNGVLIAAAVIGYMYLKRQQQLRAAQYQAATTGTVASMPGSVGTGLQQAAAGAVSGFLQSLIKGPSNNTSQVYMPSYYDPMDSVRGDIAQEAVPDVQTFPVDLAWV